MIRGLRDNGVQVIECHAGVWGEIEDKSQVSGWLQRLRLLFRWIASYPWLILRYLRLPKHDAVIIGYMGQLDVLVLWLFAKLRGVPIVWDAFISLYDTVVIDRKLASKNSIVAYLLYATEWIASRAASQLLLDTRSHAEYFEQLYRLPPHSVHHVYVGVDIDAFRKNTVVKKTQEVFTVLFYGQFIPLHGIDIIVHAAKIIEQYREKNIRWVIIGEGQEQPRIDEFIKEADIKSIHRISWIRYERLIEYINKADVCLGIFGASGKATRVIPNKVYQILAAGKPLITGDTPAIRELLSESTTVRLVEPGNPDALASAVLHLQKTLEELAETPVYPNGSVTIGYVDVGKQFLEVLKHPQTVENV